VSQFNPNTPTWLHYLETCPSTNTWAIATHQESAHSNYLNHGDVVFTPHQTAGRGQQGRTWHSPTGVLTATVVLDEIPAIQLPATSLAAGLAVIYAVEDLVPDCQGLLRLKWPNDVLLEGRKLAGILCEASSIGAISRVVVGVGLNRCVDFSVEPLQDIAHRTASLHQISNHVPQELALLERLRHYLLQAVGVLRLQDQSGQGLGSLLPALQSRDALLGQTLTVEIGMERVVGVGAGIGDRGHLLLRLPGGQIQALASGHILWPPSGLNSVSSH
jgi:BirA family transcriptional regulator, biotin operon repressor / biotin---[acetyl-CoA-carboxylase] ligase